jgi:hypothetical protein
MSERERSNTFGIIETRVFAVRSIAVVRGLLARIGVMMMVGNATHVLRCCSLKAKVMVRQAEDVALHLQRE